MSLVVLLVLAMVWAVFLVPQVVRARAEKTPADSIGAFRNQLSVLERTGPAIHGYARRSPSTGRATREQARRRRQTIVVRLLGTMVATFLVGLLVHPMMYVNFLLDTLFVSYCVLLWRARALAVERDMKVRYLPGAVSGAYGSAQPALLLQQSGS